MVLFKAFLPFALIVAVTAAATVSVVTSDAASTTATVTTTRRPYLLQTMLDRMGNSGKAMIGMVNSTALTGTKMFNDGMLGMTGAGQQVINTVSSVGSTGLSGLVDAAKHGIDFRTNMAAINPVTGRFSVIAGNLAKTGADVVNLAGQAGISVGSGIANGKMQLAGGLSSAGAGLATSGIKMGVGMANAGLDTGLRVANGVLGRVGTMMDNAVNYANQVSSKVSSKANGIANMVSVNGYSVPSTFPVSDILDKIPISGAMNGVTVSGPAVPTNGASNVQVQIAA